jgi:phage terminase small subunit
VSGLTAKQQRFVEEYLVDLNGSAAARRAGYSERTANRMASENLSKPDLAAAIFERRAKLAEQTGRTVAAVMADIGRVRDDAMKPVTDPETGEQAMLSHKDALKALELEGKHLGAFAERVEMTGKGGGPIQSVSMTPDEFRRIAQELLEGFR